MILILLGIMELSGNTTINFEKFFVPFCLFLVGLFSFYPFVVVVILSGYLASFLESFIPFLTAKGLSGILYLIVLETCYMVSFIGALLIVREMKSQSLSWKNALPLCIISGILLLSIIQIPYPPNPSTNQLLYLSISDIGLGLLPLGLWYLFKAFDEGKNEYDIKAIQSSCIIVGFIGLLFLATLFQNSVGVLTQTPLPPCRGDCFNPWATLILFSGAIYRLIFWMCLLPYLGIRIFKFIAQFQEISLKSS